MQFVDLNTDVTGLKDAIFVGLYSDVIWDQEEGSLFYINFIHFIGLYTMSQQNYSFYHFLQINLE